MVKDKNLTETLLSPAEERPDLPFSSADDIPPITTVGGFVREFNVEAKKLWYLAGPAIFTSVNQYSLGAVTQVFAGHISTISLAAVSVENSVVAGFSFGIMVSYHSRMMFFFLWFVFIIQDFFCFTQFQNKLYS